MAIDWKKKLKKALPLSLSAMMVFSAFTACGGNGASTGASGTLSGGTTTDEQGANVNFSGWGGGDGIVQASDYTWYDGKDKTNAYDEKYHDMFFFSDQKDAVTYFANAMYYDYGYVSPGNQPYVGVGVGWTPAWFEWISLIRNWTDNEWSYLTWRQYLIDQPIMNTGYVWSYDTPHWPNMGYSTCCGNYHYDNNFCYVMAICNYVGWENDLSLLDVVDQTTGPLTVDKGHETNSQNHIDAGDDASKNMTVGEKMQLAIDYVLNNLEGKNGLIIIGADDNDGKNLGRVGDYSCNYWDNIPFGYKDAYANIEFYKMLNALVEFETFRGDTVKATYYKDLAAQVKTNFNNTFWYTPNGANRYAGTVDVNGAVHDYGITFVNTEAVAAGLADEVVDGKTRAQWIYEWLNGTRIVSGDTVTGADIYPTSSTTSQPVKVAEGTVLRTNTVDFAVGGWWHDNGGSQSLSGNGKYGGHLENGGAILYTAYYDVMARIKMGDISGAYNQMALMAKEYAKDELNRDPMNTTSGGRDVLGFVGEYSESGLAPMAYLYGFIGLSQVAGGLKFTPNIPDGYKYMGVNRLVYDGRSYSVTTYKNGSFGVRCDEGVAMKAQVADTASVGTKSLTFYDEDNNILQRKTVTATNGYFTLDMTGVNNAVFVELR
ncbi:MAG: hypothetical protein IJY11_02620 [Clostridia bacterium]|nr:hypothetical protein [Clostridia bacterium]